jgi:hypothetical protein
VTRAVLGLAAAGVLVLGIAWQRPLFGMLACVLVLAGVPAAAGARAAASRASGAASRIAWRVARAAAVGVALLLAMAFVGALLLERPALLARLRGLPPPGGGPVGTRISGTSIVPTVTAPASAAENRKSLQQLMQAYEVQRGIARPPVQAPARVARPASAPAQAAVATTSMSIDFRDHDADCDADRVVPLRWCMDMAGPGYRLAGWSGPQVHGAACGSAFVNPRQVDEHCIAVDAHIKGCGYDHRLFFFRSCRGSGWLHGSFQLQGQASVPR